MVRGEEKGGGRGEGEGGREEGEGGRGEGGGRVCTCVHLHVVCVVRAPLPMCMACRRPHSAAIDRYAEIRHAPSGYHPLCSRPSVLLVRSCIAPVAVQNKGKHRIA
jgi:hypothetical protein